MAPKAATALLWRSGQFGTGQVVQVLRTLILARLLVPEDFGLMAVALITVQTVLSLTEFGMEPALVQSKEPERAHYDAAWTFGVTRALIVGALVMGTAPAVARLFGEMRAVPIIQVLALRPLVQATASVRVAELRRNLDFRPLAFVHLSGILADAALAIALATWLGVWALVVAALGSAAVLVATSYIVAPYSPRLHFDRVALKPLVRFGRWIFVTGVVATSASWVLQMIVSRTLGTADLGIYYLSAKLAFMPGQVSEKVVGDVAFPLYARLQGARDRASVTFRTLLSGTVFVIMPVFVLLICLAPGLVTDVLGPRWAGSESVIRVLAVAGLIGLFGDAAVPVFKGFGRPSRVAALEGVQSALLIVGAWILTTRFGVTGAASAWIPATSISAAFAFWFVRRSLPDPLVGLGKPMAVAVTACGLGGLVAVVLDTQLSGIGGVTLAAFAGTLVTGGIVYQAERHFDLGLRSRVRKAFRAPDFMARSSSSTAEMGGSE